MCTAIDTIYKDTTATRDETDELAFHGVMHCKASKEATLEMNDRDGHDARR